MTSRPRIHVLGLGSIGVLPAHALSESATGGQQLVTLMMHRASLFQSYNKRGSRITLRAPDGSLTNMSNYEVELLKDDRWQYLASSKQQIFEATSETIENLIICVKAGGTVAALKSLTSRLSVKSTVLFMQNGSGMIEVNRDLFPQEHLRPNYMIGVISHGVTQKSAFDVHHTGFAATSAGLVPRSSGIPEQLEGGPLLATMLSQPPRLNLTVYNFVEAFQMQLEKLVINSFCNPYCALADSENGYLFTIPEERRAIIEECVSIILAPLPELRTVPMSQLVQRFGADVLEATVNPIIHKTRHRTCSMV